MRRGLRGVHAAERRGSGEAASLTAQYGHLAVTDPPDFGRPTSVISTLDIARAIAAGLGHRVSFASA